MYLLKIKYSAEKPIACIRVLVMFFILFMCTTYGLADDAKYQEGVHYFLLPESAMGVEDPSRIEIVDVFQYKCGYCFNFYTHTLKWRESMLGDVDYKRIPATWRKNLQLPAKAYFTAKELNKLKILHPALFNAMLIDNKKLDSEEEIYTIFSKAGVSKSDFNRVFHSDKIENHIKEATNRLKSYKDISATPRLIVNGKYWISGKSAGGKNELMIDVANFLIEKERIRIKRANSEMAKSIGGV